MIVSHGNGSVKRRVLFLAFFMPPCYNRGMKPFLKTTPFAHRGLHGGTMPENSLPAFCAAVGKGYGIETDIRFTKDKKIVVFHDDDLLRMTGDGRQVSDCTYEELAALTLLPDSPRHPEPPRCPESYPPRHPESEPVLSRHPEPPLPLRRVEGSRGTESEPAHIPLFSEFLEEVKGEVPLLIEIKNMAGVKAGEIAEALSEAMQGYRGEYAVQSFNPLYVHAYKKLHKDIMCGVLGTAEEGAAKGFQAFAIKHLPLNFYTKPDFISYRKEDLPRRKVTHFKGVRLAWVVRSPSEESHLRPFVDNIIFENYLP